MRKLATIATLLSLCSMSALATTNTIFSCTAKDGSPIIVKRIGNDYELTYGKTQVKNPAKKVLADKDTILAVGSGYISKSVVLYQNKVKYLLEVSIVRNDPSNIDGQLYIGDTTVPCDTSKKVTQRFEDHLMHDVQ